MTVWTYRPLNLDPDAKIVFVLHGANRDAKRYRDQWQPHSERHEFLLVVPEFDARSFSEYEYQRANLSDAGGNAIERSRWTFHIIERLFDVVRAETGLRAARYSLYGHSGGAQFVHRFVLFMPDARYERAVAANAGWYTMPTFETSFPYGLAATLATEAELKRAMGREFVRRGRRRRIRSRSARHGAGPSPGTDSSRSRGKLSPDRARYRGAFRRGSSLAADRGSRRRTLEPGDGRGRRRDPRPVGLHWPLFRPSAR